MDPLRGHGQLVSIVDSDGRQAELDSLYEQGMIKGIHRGQK